MDYKIHVEKDGTITNTGGGEIPSDSKVITINKGVATPVQNVSPEELADIQKALSGGTVGERSI